MTNIFAVSSYRPIGCTFLNWSIHFIHGDIEFYNVLNGILPLTANPLTDKNAHGFPKNHPCGRENTQNCVDSLISNDTSRLMSFYPYANTGTNQEQCIHEYKSLVNLVIDNNIPLIYMDLPNSPLYFSTPPRTSSVQLTLTQFIEEYFPNSENYNLDNIWEFREFAALNLRPFNILPVNFVSPIKHLYINANDMWCNGTETIKEIFKFLSLPITENRLTEWIPIYHQWQSIQTSRLKFSMGIDHIIYCIIHGAYHDLTPYKIDIWKESIIQHILIFKHGLTLKSYGLEKFPNNTLALHYLLEENIYHNVENIYGLLK